MTIIETTALLMALGSMCLFSGITAAIKKKTIISNCYKLAASNNKIVTKLHN